MKKIYDALLVIDLQNGVCHGDTTICNLEKLIAHVNERIEFYAKQNRPIIYVQHCDEWLVPGEAAWQIIPQLKQAEAYMIQKTHASAFYQTNLQEVLTGLHVNTLELCGAQTEYCVDATIKVAHSLGYDLKMFPQTTTTFANQYLSAEDTIAFYEAIWHQRFVSFVD